MHRTAYGAIQRARYLTLGQEIATRFKESCLSDLLSSLIQNYGDPIWEYGHAD